MDKIKEEIIKLKEERFDERVCGKCKAIMRDLKGFWSCNICGHIIEK